MFEYIEQFGIWDKDIQNDLRFNFGQILKIFFNIIKNPNVTKL